MDFGLDALQEIIDDMRDLETDGLREKLGKEKKGLKSDKKKKKSPKGFTMIIEMAKGDKKDKKKSSDDDMLDKILNGAS